MEFGKVNVVIDGQWGSTGKGKVLGWIYENQPQGSVLAVGDNMPNAGHTVFVGDTKMVLKCLPVGALFRGVMACIGPHAVFSAARLMQECLDCYQSLGFAPNVIIHPAACVVQDDDAEREEELVRDIASTGQGSAVATCRKIMRQKGTLAGDLSILKSYVGNTAEIAYKMLLKGKMVISELSQGFDLGINYGHQYPFTTSRDVMVGRALDNVGVSPKRLGKILAVLRTFPIRVGNTENTSGPYYEDQTELLWSDLNREPELTTVTRRVRRVFTFSKLQLAKMLRHVEPDYLFLTFADYLEKPALDALVAEINSVADAVLNRSVKVRWIGNGPKSTDVEEQYERVVSS